MLSEIGGQLLSLSGN